MIKVGIVQCDIQWEDKEINLIKAENFFKQANKENVDLILFGEMSLTGFSMNTEKTAEEQSSLYTVKKISSLCIAYGIACGIGYTYQNNDNSGVMSENRYAIIDKDGNLLIDYTKIHPFSYAGESKLFAGGDKIISCRIQDFVISPFICYDLRFPEVFQAASKKSDLIIVAANWPESRQLHWETLLRARAIENQCYIAGINRIGSGGGIDYAGGSAIISPTGVLLQYAECRECMLTYELDKDELEEYKRTFPFKNDRKDPFYKTLY